MKARLALTSLHKRWLGQREIVPRPASAGGQTHASCLHFITTLDRWTMTTCKSKGGLEQKWEVALVDGLLSTEYKRKSFTMTRSKQGCSFIKLMVSTVLLLLDGNSLAVYIDIILISLLCLSLLSDESVSATEGCPAPTEGQKRKVQLVFVFKVVKSVCVCVCLLQAIPRKELKSSSSNLAQ